MWGINAVYRYLEALEKFGMNLGLDRITYLLARLGDPHLKLRSIHIAGTNGKGSTAVMISSMLKEAGYRVGLYTSPHLFDYRERIKVNGRDISRKDLEAGLEKVRKISGRMKSKPTVFEALTAAAFWYFARKQVDYAVVEVGLGGRLDATNVITPLVTVITNIDYEHTEVLGRTLARIAGEKAAVIKPGIPVVTAEEKAEPLRVIKRTAQRQDSLLIQVGKRQEAIGTRMMGEHQKLNAACAIAAIRLGGIEVSRRSIRKGLNKAAWPGRFQVVLKNPLVLVDGAHNPAGARALRVTIKKVFPGRFSVVFGCQGTKDHDQVLRELAPVISELIITRSSHRLAADPNLLVRSARRRRIPFVVAGSVGDALKRWDRTKPLLITGSLFTVSDALKYLDVAQRA